MTGPLRRVGRSAIVLSALAVIAVLLGRPAVVVLLAVSLVLLTQAATLAPAALAHAEHGLARGVGRVVSGCLLAMVFVVLLVPSLLLWLLGLDPLGGTGQGWQRLAAAHRVRPRRLFADDLSVTRAPGGGRTWRVAVGLVAVGAVAATFVPRLVDDLRDDPDDPRATTGDFVQMVDTAALADAPWADEVGADLLAAGGNWAYTPFVGFSLPDYESRYVNLADRQRRSYQPAGADEDTPDIWFFGGSTMFGLVQRDDHTIPSEVARLAEDEGMRLRVHNYGVTAYANFQETVLFAQLLLTGQRPDLVVFFDGFNDMAIQSLHAFGGAGELGAASDLMAFQYSQALTAAEITRTAAPPVGLEPAVDLGRPPSAESFADGVLRAYGEGVELSRRLGASYDVPIVHFWQPSMYSKDPLVDGETDLLEPLGLDPAAFEASSGLFDLVRRRLPSDVLDITDAYDGAEGPILTDLVHSNEHGARLVAEAMFEHLGPALRQMSASS